METELNAFVSIRELSKHLPINPLIST